jgi:small subunit ribosomal protein S20
MANTKSAIKAARQALRRQDRNQTVKSRLKTLSRKLAKLTAESKNDEARAVAVEFISALDKAAKSNVVHKNVVARHKSKLSKLVLAKA